MRQAHLICYDVADDRRRGTVLKTLRGFGLHLQYSVFFVELSARELVRLTARLEEAINHAEDRILFANLGPVPGRGDMAVTHLGTGFTPPNCGPIIC